MTTGMPKNLAVMGVFVLFLPLCFRNPLGGSAIQNFTFSDPPGRSMHGTIKSSSPSLLEYDHYRQKCPQAEKIIRSSISRIFSDQKDVAPQLLRLLFHDCFIEGCDASVFLDDSNGNISHPIERKAIPNLTLKGFDKIQSIKEELEMACPGVVSCSDILVLATRDAIIQAGGPFYPVSTGRRDSNQSYFGKATAEIPPPHANISETLRLFGLRGFTVKETVALLGAHNIGKIGCDFIQPRLRNFLGTGHPDPSLHADVVREIQRICGQPSTTTNSRAASFVISSRGGITTRAAETGKSIPYSQGLSSMQSGAVFDTHYYESLMKGKGLLFADQQLMADENTAEWVRLFASDDGTIFRREFARAIAKMANFGVLTGTQGQVRLNCSLPLLT